MRIFYAIFFFCVLSTTLLPVEEVVKNLWSQTAAEEEVTPQQLTLKMQPTNNKLWYLDFSPSGDSFSSQSAPNFIIVDEALIKCYHLEVLTQPPNLTLLA
ncbi:MAG TPA: hypothetical protein VKZ76_00765 [Edaphocola sp.]|nr:hypothetical protein [Edaphocola sp.]